MENVGNENVKSKLENAYGVCFHHSCASSSRARKDNGALSGVSYKGTKPIHDGATS